VRLLKSNPYLRLVNDYMVDSPQPVNLSYMWNMGSLLGLCLVLQILSGLFLSMHYTPTVAGAFISVESIMRDVNFGWVLRYLHANVASFFFIFVYLHIGRGLYYGSYKAPRELTWYTGVIILVLLMAIGFLGYVLPYGQMSLWGATVITNLLSAIPFFGQSLVELIWGGFSVSNATLNRFFSLHFILPFVLAALVVGHLIALHNVGSNNPNGIIAADKKPMHPYFIFKDLVTYMLFFAVLAATITFAPNAMGHSDNYIPGNPMVTPSSIVPEWYLLPFYAILRSIPSKLFGVIAMFAALLILAVLPVSDTSETRSAQFKPIMKIAFWTLVATFVFLILLGSEHPEAPFTWLGQIATALYFGYFTVIIASVGVVGNTAAGFLPKSH